MEFTVICPAYNARDFIIETIKSVENQTYQNWQMIIFDDGSTDDTYNICAQFSAQNPKIRLLKHADGGNKGLKQTLLCALECVKTQYIAFLECDDYWHKDYLKEKAAFLRENPSCAVVFNAVEPFGEKERVRRLKLYYFALNFYLRLRRPFCRLYDLKAPLFSFNAVPTFSCICARRDVLEGLDFSSPFRPWLDYYLCAQIALKHRFCFMKKKLTFWRLHTGSYTMRSLGGLNEGEKKFRSALAKIYKEALPPWRYYFIKTSDAVYGFIFKVFFLIPFKFFYRILS